MLGELFKVVELQLPEVCNDLLMVVESFLISGFCVDTFFERTSWADHGAGFANARKPYRSKTAFASDVVKNARYCAASGFASLVIATG